MSTTPDTASIPAKNGLNQPLPKAGGGTCSLEYFCEACEYYPLRPVHGHYECPQCGYKTKCCEGAPQD